MRTAALGNFVLMMRKNQVLSAAVNVDRGAQVLTRHGRALQVPARAPSPPGAVPPGQVGGRWFPQDEIGRILLVGGDLDAGAGYLAVAITAGQLTVLRIVVHPEKNVFLRLVGVAGIQQALNQADHLRNVLGGPRPAIRHQYPQRLDIFLPHP